MRKTGIIILTAAALTVLSAADGEESKRTASKKKTDSVEVTMNNSQQSLGKARKVDPGKTNWSKIKNLFL